ncbi:transmembrane protein [Legionella adelaidensis]|uniref:Transmembrane protein n=1 Tax=Legionella adelaidensis TaxID=45056 RepID=A0A0W0R4A3_9GAMM|nr:hypothetical protein [Legionella adelaidensis]KTC65891.1 transmembrane protein [Legionella adelaidensis]
MEPNRFRQNETLYFVGILFLLISLCLLAFTLYITPFLLLKWVYDVPEFLMNWVHWLQRNEGYTDTFSRTLVFLFFLMATILSGFIAYLCSNSIENRVFTPQAREDNIETPRERRDRRDTYRLLIQIILIVLFVFVGVAIFELLIYIPPPSERL